MKGTSLKQCLLEVLLGLLVDELGGIVMLANLAASLEQADVILSDDLVVVVVRDEVVEGGCMCFGGCVVVVDVRKLSGEAQCKGRKWV